ncbi:MAG TPA: hypothetical protein PLW68_03590 [Casimicrobiaceae bacterium]|nr:hypothetical protein [Casimicrobiaceae bacterium]
MNAWRHRVARRYDDITIPAIRVAFVLSLLVHAAALWTYLPKLQLLTPTDAEKGDSGSPLAVRLADPRPPQGSMPSPPPPPEPRVALRAPSPSPPPPPARRPPSPPPVASAPRQTPDAVALPTTPPTPPQPAPSTDLAAYIESRRRERGEQPASSSASPSDAKSDEDERQNRIIAANIGTSARPSFGREARNGGGVFQVKSLEYSYAEFYFFGWNKDISRNSKQVIEVRKGDNSNIRIAVVRKMIEIIREHESGDFLWESHRLGRQLTLSARARDTAELETFMMQEFFFDVPGQR